MNLTEQYRRFRAWQREPRRYSDKEMGEHRCANCGHDFTGNYCPVCGQKASWGRITWAAVRENVMLLWGMDSHSMPYSLFQLLLRPGYLIGEYIGGRRQVSYPPVKMLFILAIFYAIVEQLFGMKDVSEMSFPEELSLIGVVVDWMRDNPGWAMLSSTMIMLLPTWVLFRFSPQHSRHTLPEGFFIQIFMAILLLICSFLSDIIGWLILTIPFYYYFAYRQLFCYHFWGTCWRLGVSAVVWACLILVIAVALIIGSTNSNHDIFVTYIIGIFFMLAFVAILLVAGYWVSKLSEKRRLKKASNQT